jgi:16S rRNA (guanine527-N7)-methyltransferase
MEIITKYFTELTQEQTNRFIQLKPFYSDLNKKINVISRKDIENLYERHILHSLAIAKIVSFEKETTILDAGTGGGFPGIPLAIMFPHAHFHLIDSIGKKIKGVETVVSQLGLTNVTARQTRLEEIKEKYNFIVSRAVATIPQMLAWSKGLIKPGGTGSLPNGMLYLKGGDFSEELRLVRRNYVVHDLSNFFEEEFFQTKKLVHIW